MDIDFCLSYFNGRCQTCDVFATLNQNRCVPNYCNIYDYVQGLCTNCIDKYQLISRRCYIIIIGCSSYTTNGLCSVCLPGYTLISPTLCQKQQ